MRETCLKLAENRGQLPTDLMYTIFKKNVNKMINTLYTI